MRVMDDLYKKVPKDFHANLEFRATRIEEDMTEQTLEIDRTLSQMIRLHWGFDKSLIPDDVGWLGDGFFFAVDASVIQSDSAATDLICMAYLDKLAALTGGIKWHCTSDGWTITWDDKSITQPSKLAAVVCAYESIRPASKP